MSTSVNLVRLWTNLSLVSSAYSTFEILERADFETSLSTSSVNCKILFIYSKYRESSC